MLKLLESTTSIDEMVLWSLRKKKKFYIDDNDGLVAVVDLHALDLVVDGDSRVVTKSYVDKLGLSSLFNMNILVIEEVFL